jgi:DNA repair exonuclease SbcCD nuclease subunit
VKVKFAHISDVHLGAWRNERLNEMGFKAFEKTVKIIIEESVDFVLICGDLYDVSNPNVEVVDLATKLLKKLNDHGISVYGIMGSHDFSPSNKSMMRPLISAGLFFDVSKGHATEENKLLLDFAIDPKTKIKLTGLRARKRSLEIEDYHNLDRKPLEAEKGPKIFILHTMMSELKPREFKDMVSAPKSLLPQGFDYYAGGHLHKLLPEKLNEKGFKLKINHKNNIVYPGALFPTDFRELERIKCGGFCLVSGDITEENLNLIVEFKPIKVIDIESIFLDCTNKSVLEVKNLLKQELENKDLPNKIVTIRIFGQLTSGKTFEIKSNEIIQTCKEKGAYEVLINKNALTTEEYKSISIPVGETSEEIETALIKEHATKVKISNFSSATIEDKIHQLLNKLGEERQIGTKVLTYNKLLEQTIRSIFEFKDSKEQER